MTAHEARAKAVSIHPRLTDFEYDKIQKEIADAVIDGKLQIDVKIPLIVHENVITRLQHDGFKACADGYHHNKRGYIIKW